MAACIDFEHLSDFDFENLTDEQFEAMVDSCPGGVFFVSGSGVFVPGSGPGSVVAPGSGLAAVD